MPGGTSAPSSINSLTTSVLPPRIAIDNGETGSLLSAMLTFAPRRTSSRTISGNPDEAGNAERQARYALAVIDFHRCARFEGGQYFDQMS